MEHYICAGECGAESQTPGVCKTDGCSSNGKEFEKCSCLDGEHGKVRRAENGEELSTEEGGAKS